jgi:hypothetical protein
MRFREVLVLAQLGERRAVQRGLGHQRHGDGASRSARALY